MRPPDAEGPSKWRPGAPKMNSQDAKMLPKSSKMRPESAKMDPHSVPLATQMGHGSPPCGPTCCRKQILVSPGAAGPDFGCPRTPIWEDLASILSKRFNSILFHFDSTLFLSVPLHSTQLPSIPFHSIQFHSIRFHSIAISLHAVLGFQSSGTPESDASKIPICRFPDLEPLIGLGGMREA